MFNKPELVAPGGNFEKVKIAFTYGADAVYLGVEEFGLRKSAQNLTFLQLHEAVELANTLNKKVYVVLNGYTFQDDLEKLPYFLEKLESAKVHALIISDLGTMRMAKKYSTRPLHTSTQASISNWKAAEEWKKVGAKRVVVARECDITECKEIQEKADIEVETFVHGAMCVSYSGKCTISNYSSGRDSNRGGCIQTCRHPFEFNNEPNEDPVYLMNAKDLMGVSLIPEIKKAGLHSLKIEGRMKSNLYLANTVSIYRDAIDTNVLTDNQIDTYETKLKTISNRGFTDGSLHKKADAKESVSSKWNGYSKGSIYLGTIKHKDDQNFYYAEIKGTFHSSENLEVLMPNQLQNIPLNTELFTLSNQKLERVRQNSIVKFKSNTPLELYSILQKPLFNS